MGLMYRRILTAILFIVTAPSFAEEPAPLIVFMPPSAEELAEIANPDLRAELLRLASEDQRARLVGGCGSDVSALDTSEIDRRNTARLQELVAEHGWPTAQTAGHDGARAAWLIAQHADHDLDWQRRALELIEPHGDPIDVAYLTDRVRVNEGRPQLYGTQFETVDGRRVPRPIEDPEAVDERRKGLGMRSLEAYTKFVNT